MINPYADTAILLLFYMTAWYLLALRKMDNSIADIAWGLGFVMAGWYINQLYGNSYILMVMITIWGIRLALHIYFRNRGKAEDWRYREWRDQWGACWRLKAYLKVFLLQGGLLWIIALPLFQPGPQFHPMGLFQWVGLLLWVIGFSWEAISDWQLYKFKSKPGNKGAIYRKGLWKYSRHPNYFGEIVLWWGIYIFTLPDELWHLHLLSPLTITILLAKVSGVPMLEKKYRGNTAYEHYRKNTNALLPDLSKLLTG